MNLELEQYQRLYLIPYFGNWDLTDIKRAGVRKFLEGLRSVKNGEPASQTVKAKTRDALRHLMNYAATEEDIQPVNRNLFPKIEKPKRQLFTVDKRQQQEIIACVPVDKRCVFEFASMRPHRTNELRAIRVSDVNWLAKTYRLNGSFDQMDNYKPFLKVKKTTGAEFPLDDVEEIFREALKGREVGSDDYIFVNAENGRAWTHRQLDGVYRRAALKAGFSKVTLEMFGRHSWVTNKLNEGWSLTDVAHWALDRVSTIESHYANVTAAVRQSVMDINEQRAARR